MPYNFQWKEVQLGAIMGIHFSIWRCCLITKTLKVQLYHRWVLNDSSSTNVHKCTPVGFSFQGPTLGIHGLKPL